MAKKEEQAANGAPPPAEQMPAPASETPGKEKKAKKEKKGKKEKKKGGPGGIIVLVILVILVVGGLAASVFFNLFGIRDKMIGFLVSFEPEYVHYTELLADVEAREAALTEQEELITADQEALTARSAALDEREAALLEEETRYTPVLRGNLTESQLADMKTLGRIYSGMAPDNAANIILEMHTIADMAIIFFYMDAASAAAVMELLPTDTAAEVTTVMLRN